MAFKPIYRNRDSWVLCSCTQCGALNYVEPHGTTADCKLCGESTEHTNIPHDQRDISGCYYIGRKKK
jgi:hypothetical protein